jgi:hypothetical protein
VSTVEVTYAKASRGRLLLAISDERCAEMCSVAILVRGKIYSWYIIAP